MLLLMGLAALVTSGAAEESAPAESAEGAAAQEPDETKQLLDQLTITLVSEVVDARTVLVRDSKAKPGRKNIHIRLGNVATPERGAGASDEEHEAKLNKSKEALEKFVGKQMIWYKAAPDEHQPPDPAESEGKDAPAVIVGDAWLIDGRHLNSLLAKEGHLVQEQQYHSDLARNILSAEADESKKESYKKLEEALRESEKEKKRMAEEKIAEEKLKGEPIGVAGWIGLAVLGVTVVAGFCYGGGSKKKVNLNRKRGTFEKLWMKLKGA